MKKLLVVLLVVIGLTGCSSTSNTDEVENTTEQKITNNNEELEELKKMKNEVVLYMTNIQKQYDEKEDVKGYLFNVYSGPAMKEKLDKIKSIEISSDLGEELKSKLSSTWINFQNALLESSSDDVDKESLDRSVSVIKENIEFLEENLK